MTKVAYVFWALGLYILVACSGQKSGQGEGIRVFIPDSNYVRQGDQLVKNTFDTLRNSLQAAIGLKGLDGAISFCNERAYGLTATYADSVLIRRAALRYRNPANRPDSIEHLVLKEMQFDMQSGKMPTSKVVRTQTLDVHYFKPIILQPMCLNCHGRPGKEINELTLAKIKAIYPADSAINFNVGDLRGAWHVMFKEKLQGVN